MRLFWVIVLFGSNLVSAASVAVITEESSSFSSSCSAGMTSLSPCPPGIPGATGGISGPDYQVGANAGPSPVGPPTFIPGARMVSVGVDAAAEYSCGPVLPCPPFVPLSASANASASISGYTEGPSRLGSIQVSVVVGSNHDSPPGFGFSDGTNFYGIGAGAPPGSLNPCCGGAYDATLPFMLGGPFSAGVSANAGSGVSSCPVDSYPITCVGAGPSANAVISFVLLEPDGSAIPFVSTPEPGPWALCILGLLFAIPRVRRSRR
ncbi:MAG TPA: hypothetical protein VHZ55_21855 [Bryobacteraceae bacterium]|nr:hypothetical protein [Bryobacteraceae bacterium]